MFTIIYISALLDKTNTFPSDLSSPWQQYTASFPKRHIPKERYPHPNKMATQNIDRTLYITTNTGQTIAYRRLGPAHGIPLVMHSEPTPSLSP